MKLEKPDTKHCSHFIMLGMRHTLGWILFLLIQLRLVKVFYNYAFCLPVTQTLFQKKQTTKSVPVRW